MPSPLKIAAAQIDIAFADAAKNLARMEAVLRETAAAGAMLTIFPECALAGYCFDSLEEAQPHAQTVPGPATDQLAGVCRELNCFTAFGLLEKAGDKLYNACALVGPRGFVGAYRKVHLPFLGIDRFVAAGDRFDVWDIGLLRVGLSICYDGSFPESARVMALSGADLIALPTNWPEGASCTARYVINTRAHENHVYYAAVDRVGTERGFGFIGYSRICEPGGETLALADHVREEILYAEINPAKARNKHLVRVPKLHEIDRFADRRPEVYGKIVAPVEGKS